ncbi:hypothetical protein ACFVKB_48970 [Rhodococcus sp. NPDC127530]|uniref:hypothetical protein n=1 Tax=unclassified Rhodococcus (in: high G+C Gram-positive bacteria) TaxID=192944 RepID=UPI00363C2935
MSSHTAAPGIIVFVHGLRMTPRSWEDWVKYYGSKGYTVLTPPNSGFEIEVEAMRENPEVIANLTVAETVDHLAGVIELLDTLPSLMNLAVPRSEESREPPQTAGFTPEEFHYAFTNTLTRRNPTRCKTAITSPHHKSGWGVRPDREIQARPPGDLGGLRQGRSRAVAVHRWRSRPHHAAVGEQVEYEALSQARCAHEIPRVRRPLPLDVW